MKRRYFIVVVDGLDEGAEFRTAIAPANAAHCEVQVHPAQRLGNRTQIVATIDETALDEKKEAKK